MLNVYFLLSSGTLYSISVHYEIMIAVLIEIISIYQDLIKIFIYISIISQNVTKYTKCTCVFGMILPETFISYAVGQKNNKNQLII